MKNKMTQTKLLKLIKKHKKLKLAIKRLGNPRNIDRERIIEVGRYVRYHFKSKKSCYYISCFESEWQKPSIEKSVKKMFAYDARIRREIYRVYSKGKTIWSAT